MFFASDNASGAAPEIMAALAEANTGHAPGYGADDWSGATEAKLSELFERPVKSFLVTTGTAANALALSLYQKPGAMIVCHEESHIAVDECGAPELLSGGMRLFHRPGLHGKLDPSDVSEAIDRHFVRGVHTGRPAVLSLTNLNEYGAAYSPDEVKALTDVARRNAMAVHMDGARFANVVARLGVSPAELTWKAGVDVLTFGGTKNGCWAVEAIVVFDPDKTEDLPFLRKRSGHLLSKGRFLGAQMDAYLADGLWLRLARASNAAAARLAAGLKASSQARLLVEPDGNDLFPVLSRAGHEALQAAGARYYPWDGLAFAADEMPGPDEVLVRLVTSFNTTDADVDRFLEILETA